MFACMTDFCNRHHWLCTPLWGTAVALFYCSKSTCSIILFCALKIGVRFCSLYNLYLIFFVSRLSLFSIPMFAIIWYLYFTLSLPIFHTPSSYSALFPIVSTFLMYFPCFLLYPIYFSVCTLINLTMFSSCNIWSISVFIKLIYTSHTFLAL